MYEEAGTSLDDAFLQDDLEDVDGLNNSKSDLFKVEAGQLTDTVPKPADANSGVVNFGSFGFMSFGGEALAN